MGFCKVCTRLCFYLNKKVRVYLSSPVRDMCILPLYDSCLLVMQFILHVIMQMKSLCPMPATTLAYYTRCYSEVFKKQQTQEVAKKNLRGEQSIVDLSQKR